MQHWRDVAIDVAKETSANLAVPEVGDWIQSLPCAGEGNFECNGWQHVRLIRNGIQSKGWVPDWLISHGCTRPPPSGLQGGYEWRGLSASPSEMARGEDISVEQVGAAHSGDQRCYRLM